MFRPIEHPTTNSPDGQLYWEILGPPAVLADVLRIVSRHDSRLSSAAAIGKLLHSDIFLLKQILRKKPRLLAAIDYGRKRG